MIRNEITKFLSLASLIMPDIIRDDKIVESDITDDYAILYFTFGEKLSIGHVMDSCDSNMELLMLYHAFIEQTPQLQHCCFFPMPKDGESMFKINIVTDSRGFTNGITVTVFDTNAPDIWEQSLKDDIVAHFKNFKFTEVIKDNELLSLFMNIL